MPRRNGVKASYLAAVLAPRLEIQRRGASFLIPPPRYSREASSHPMLWGGENELMNRAPPQAPLQLVPPAHFPAG
jgi:hypothetical protein